MSKRDPIERLANLAAECAESWVYQLSDDKVGDTPIEHILYVAMCVYTDFVVRDFALHSLPKGEVLDPDRQDAWYNTPNLDRDKVVLARQCVLTDYRVDFALYVRDQKLRWHVIVIECDGHDYHERTKEQAAKDRSRDREFQIKGIPVLRFTGSEIWRAPEKCAEQIFELAFDIAFKPAEFLP